MTTKNTLNILYEDPHIIVCKKPAGVATQTKSTRSLDMENLIKRHLYQTSNRKSEPYLAVVHRLDQPVSGILVFGKTPDAARELNKQLQSHGFGKHYKALLTNVPTPSEQTLTQYLRKDSRTNSSSICKKDDTDSKIAKLHYQLITSPTEADYALFSHCNTDELRSLPMVDILLDTGRHHQIRVQMSSLGCPIWGDTKYGVCLQPETNWTSIALCAYRLEFKHPITHKVLSFTL